jgi:hypothetical protein
VDTYGWRVRVTIKEAQLHLLSNLGFVAIKMHLIIKLQAEAKHIVEVEALLDLNT